jgi:hypothetical protein
MAVNYGAVGFGLSLASAVGAESWRTVEARQQILTSDIDSEVAYDSNGKPFRIVLCT